MSRNARIDRVFRSLLGVSTAVRVLLAATLDLVPDEAYYWVWSRHLAPGYLDHPPLVAFFIAAGTHILGDTRPGVRLFAVACGTLMLYVFFDALRLMVSRRHALLATLALAVTPAAVAGGVLATPDAPLILGWALAIRGLAGLTQGVGDRRKALALTIAGVIVACLSKLTGLVLMALVVTWPVARRLMQVAGPEADPDDPERTTPRGARPSVNDDLSRRDMLILLAVTLVAFLPVALWSIEHGGYPFAYQWRRTLGTGRGGGLESLALFLAGQVAIIGPVLFWLAVVQWTRLRASSRLLFWLSAPLMVFFALAALRTRVEPNWPAPAYLGMVAMIPWQHLGQKLRRVAIGASLALSTCAVVLIVLPASWWGATRTPTARFQGWDRLAEGVSVQASPHLAWVVTARYQEAAEIDFHLAGKSKSYGVTALPGLGRPDQYDLFEPPVVKKGQDILWLTKAGTGSAPSLVGFRRVVGPLTISRGPGAKPRAYHLYRLEDAEETLVLHAPR